MKLRFGNIIRNFVVFVFVFVLLFRCLNLQKLNRNGTVLFRLLYPYLKNITL